MNKRQANGVVKSVRKDQQREVCPVQSECNEEKGACQPDGNHSSHALIIVRYSEIDRKQNVCFSCYGFHDRFSVVLSSLLRHRHHLHRHRAVGEGVSLLVFAGVDDRSLSNQSIRAFRQAEAFFG